MDYSDSKEFAAVAMLFSLKDVAMNQTRRQMLLAAVGAGLLGTSVRTARAGGYPSRPVHVVVGFPAGGPLDIIARLTAQWLAERLAQPFFVENRPGAGGNLATEAVVRAAPDGYTLLVCGPVNTINTTLYDKLPFDFAADIRPVGSIVQVPLVMLVNPSFPARTVSAFITWAKAHPGQVNFASGSNGTPQHVAGELFKVMANVDMQHVPYRGSALALTDLIGGQVQVMFESMPSTVEFINSGRLRALAVTTLNRSAVLPQVPTVADVLPSYEAYSWYGIVAPRDTPVEIVSVLNRGINSGLADAGFEAHLSRLGGTALGGSSEDFGKLIENETNKWGRIVRGAHIKLG
jgi:tripartite-type tricarboxylate transporter receptor subunit TctC